MAEIFHVKTQDYAKTSAARDAARHRARWCAKRKTNGVPRESLGEGGSSWRWSWESKGTPPPGNKALLRDYENPLVSLNKALLNLIKPLFLGLGGGVG